MIELLRNEKTPPKDCQIGFKGKTVVITGATSGIGLAAARRFAEYGARLIFLNRDPQKSALLEEELHTRYGVDTMSVPVDFSSLDQVRRCAETLLDLPYPIDVLIHNAGVFHTKRQFTGDGIETVFQVNHLSSFYLNYLLADRLVAEDRARILYVNSEGHRFALSGVHLKDLEWRRHIYSGLASYGAAKTAQLLTMTKFEELFASCSVSINAMHPGNVLSNIGENNGRIYRRFKKKFILSSAEDPEVSALALHYLSASPDLDGISGRFFNLTTEERPAPHGRDSKAVEPVWRKSLELCGIASGEYTNQ